MSARAGRTLAATGIVVSAACVTLLHLLRTDLPPLAHRLSEYATGPYGWLMTLAFVALAAGLAGFAVFLWATNEKIGASIALIAAVATVVSAAFPTNVSKASEAIHSPASTAAVLALLALAVIHTLGTGVGRAEPAALALTSAVLLLAALGPLLHDTRWSGLGQRLLWMALLAWLLVALSTGTRRALIRSEH